jgi:hypothetical protein
MKSKIILNRWPAADIERDYDLEKKTWLLTKRARDGHCSSSGVYSEVFARRVQKNKSWKKILIGLIADNDCVDLIFDNEVIKLKFGDQISIRSQLPFVRRVELSVRGSDGAITVITLDYLTLFPSAVNESFLPTELFEYLEYILAKPERYRHFLEQHESNNSTRGDGR